MTSEQWEETHPHMNKTYGSSLGWTHERVASGEIEIEEEPTRLMLADPLTKINNGDIFLKRGIIVNTTPPLEDATLPEQDGYLADASDTEAEE